MNVALLVSGALMLTGAGVHGIVGERLVVQRLTPAGLPSSQFGGPVMTKLMIRATWHITTIAFLTTGIALVLAGSILEGDTARAVGVVAAAASTGFAGVVLGGVLTGSPRALFRHPAPIGLTVAAVLAWVGVA